MWTKWVKVWKRYKLPVKTLLKFWDVMHSKMTKVNNVCFPRGSAVMNTPEREKNQINKIINEKGEVTTAISEIQRIIRDYYEELYASKLDNLEEMDRSLEKFIVPRLNQEEIEIMNNPSTSTEIKTDQNTPKNESPWSDHFTGEFYQTFRE